MQEHVDPDKDKDNAKATSNPTYPYLFFDIVISRIRVTMAHNAALIADIEALLTVAKSYEGIDLSTDRRARLDLLGRVEALHYQLDNPSDAMFR